MIKTQLNIMLKEGNPAAFEELFKQTFPRMLGYCSLFINDQAQANDLVQDCFVRLWEKRQTIDPRQSVESLLFVMLRNRCLNYLRDKKNDLIEKKISALEETELQHLYQLDFTGREEKSIEEQLIEAIKEAVEELPEKRKLVFIGAKIEGKKNKDVAEELGISVKAVEKHLHQAKEQIRKEMLAKFPLWAVLITILLK
jgi:RNA polymerase sigma-70 factor (ECF subfamily)